MTTIVPAGTRESEAAWSGPLALRSAVPVLLWHFGDSEIMPPAGMASIPRVVTLARVGSARPAPRSGNLDPVLQRVTDRAAERVRSKRDSKSGFNVAKIYLSWIRADVDRVALEVGETPSDV
jgi:hypothetical protein